MSEEPTFKSLKITLSEEALTTLEKIIKAASFRSYSSGIEECIRATHDVMDEIYTVCGYRDDPSVFADDKRQAEAFNRIIMRMSRLTGRVLAPNKPKNSAGR